MLVRRVLDAQGRSRAFVNGHPVTLAQLGALGELLVDLHGQHAHQSLEHAEEQRSLLDAFGGFVALAREVAAEWRTWRAAVEHRDAAANAAEASAAEREYLAARQRELAALAMGDGEWAELSTAQSRLGNASALLEAATAGEEPARRRRRCADGAARAVRPAACRHSPATTPRSRRSSRCWNRPASSSPRPRARCATTGGGSTSIPPSSRASRPVLRRCTMSRASTACGPRPCPRSVPRPRPVSRRSPSRRTPRRWRAPPPRPRRATARSRASCRRSAASPRTSSRIA